MSTRWIDLWQDFKRNRGALAGLILILTAVAVALLAPWIAPFDPTEIHQGKFLLPPYWREASSFLLGTDDVGRDLLSRLIFGTQVSLSVGFLVVLISCLIGTLLGLIAGYREGWVESAIMRVMDLLLALPSLLIALVVITILGQSLINSVVAVSLTSIPNFVRLVRAQVKTEKKKNYVIASMTFGAGHLRQIFVNILPNCAAPILVQGTLSFSDGILNVAALGFLGMGAKAPTPEWGTMLSDSRSFIESAPILVVMPGLCILVVVLAFNLFGDGLRDALDPKLRSS